MNISIRYVIITVVMTIGLTAFFTKQIDTGTYTVVDTPVPIEMSPVSSPVVHTVIAGYHRPVTETEFECLALNVYHEARGESELGRIAVTFSVLNRSNSNQWSTYSKSKHLCDFVRSPYQYSWYNNGYKPATDEAGIELARLSVESALRTYSVDNELIGNATHYHNPRKVKVNWVHSGRQSPTTTVGNHTFSVRNTERVINPA